MSHCGNGSHEQKQPQRPCAFVSVCPINAHEVQYLRGKKQHNADRIVHIQNKQQNIRRSGETDGRGGGKKPAEQSVSAEQPKPQQQAKSPDGEKKRSNRRYYHRGKPKNKGGQAQDK